MARPFRDEVAGVHIDQGVDIKSVGVFLQKGPASIEFLADKNIKSIKDLKGKTVVAKTGSEGEAFAKSISSLTLCTGTAALTTSSCGTDVRKITGAKSPCLNGIFL